MLKYTDFKPSLLSAVHREVRKRGGELHQRAGQEDPHRDRSTGSAAGVFGTFHFCLRPLKRTSTLIS